MKHETPESDYETPPPLTDWAFIARLVNLTVILFIFTLGFSGYEL